MKRIISCIAAMCFSTLLHAQTPATTSLEHSVLTPINFENLYGSFANKSAVKKFVSKTPGASMQKDHATKRFAVEIMKDGVRTNITSNFVGNWKVINITNDSYGCIILNNFLIFCGPRKEMPDGTANSLYQNKYGKVLFSVANETSPELIAIATKQSMLLNELFLKMCN